MDSIPKPRIKGKVLDKVCCGCGEIIPGSAGTSWIAHGPECLKVTSELPIQAAMRRQVKGALKSAISDHGPITKNLIGSVLKRLENQPVYRSILDGREKAEAA